MDSYGYFTQSGFNGRLPDGRWMLFASYSDYEEYISEQKEDKNDVA